MVARGEHDEEQKKKEICLESEAHVNAILHMLSVEYMG